MTAAPGYCIRTGPGIVCMIVGAGLLTTSDGVVKWLADGYPISQIIVLRGAFILLPMFILAWRMAHGEIGVSARIKTWSASAARDLIHGVGVFVFEWAAV